MPPSPQLLAVTMTAVEVEHEQNDPLKACDPYERPAIPGNFRHLADCRRISVRCVSILAGAGLETFGIRRRPTSETSGGRDVGDVLLDARFLRPQAVRVGAVARVHR